MCQTFEIERYTVALYREKYKQPANVGSGVLITFKDKYFLISAYHVFDLEEEQLRIENDPDEEGIPQDDMDLIMVKTKNGYYCVNYNMTGVVFTVEYNPDTQQPIFNEDTEWCYCELSEEIANQLIYTGKVFFEGDLIKNIDDGAVNMVISGFPQYAQKVEKENHRTFKVEKLIHDSTLDNSLMHVGFNNNKAYCYEIGKHIKLPPYGISGMSGGGIWVIKDDEAIPLGIILKQDPNEKFIECIRIECILNSIRPNNRIV